MPTEIVQTESNGRTYLRVSGDMLIDDARLLAKLAVEMNEASRNGVTIDLADLDFLDSDSAPILRRVQVENGIVIEGMEIFLQTAIDLVERTAK